MGKKSIVGEVATNVIDTLYKEFDYDFSDEVIKKMIKDIDIACAVNSIKRGICAKELNISAYNEEDNELVGEIESRLNFDTLTGTIKHIIDSKFYGYSICEIVFDEEWNYKTKAKANGLFDFDKDRKQWFYKSGSTKTYIDESKFLISVHNPHLAYKGESLLYELYKDYQLKTDLDKNLAGLIDRYGDRIIWYIYDPNLEDEEVKKQAEALKAARKSHVIAFPGGEGLEMNKQFGFINLSDLKTEIHTQLLTRYEKKIDKYLLGNTLAQNEGSNGKGSYSQAKVHSDQQELVILDHTTYVEEQLTKILKMDAQIHGYDPNKFYIKLSDKLSVDEEIERDLKLKDVEEKKTQIMSNKMDVLSKLSQSGYELDETELIEWTGFKTLRKKDSITEFSKKKRGKIAESRHKREMFNNIMDTRVKDLNIGIVEPKEIKDIFNLEIDLSEVEQDFIIALLMGYSHEKNNRVEFGEEINPFDLPFDEAIKYFVDIERIGYDYIEEIKSEVYENFRYILDNTNLELQMKLLKNIRKNLERGGTLEEWFADCKDHIEQSGIGKGGSYYETVYRTNVQTAYSIGHYKAQEENKEHFGYWLYDGIKDGREQDHTKKYDGKVFRADDPIWNYIYPPNNYNCRCDVIALSKEDVESYGYKVERRNKNRVTEAKKTLGTFGYNPAKNYYSSIQKKSEEKKEKVESLKRDVAWAKIQLDDINKLDNSTRKKIAKELLFNQGIDTKISVRKLKGFGAVRISDEEVVEYILKSTDVRTPESRLKTIFHEAVHASAKKRSVLMKHELEETYAETIGSYLVKANGYDTSKVAVSYMDILPRAFDQLRKQKQFSKVKTIDEFGEVLYNLGRDKINKLNIDIKGIELADEYTEYLSRYTFEEMREESVTENFLNVQCSNNSKYRELIKKDLDKYFETGQGDGYILGKLLAALYTVKGVR